MSAFLKFSQKRRSAVKERNPDMSNTDVSRLLGEMWRSASPSERAPYVEEEEKERAAYKAEIQKWRDEQASIDASTRTSHREVVSDIAEEMHASAPSQRQHRQDSDPAHPSFYDPANAYVSYEPIRLHYSTEVTSYPNDHHPRDVFRSYSGSHHAHHHDVNQRVVHDHRPRVEAPNVYSYRFGGPFNQAEPVQHHRSSHHYQGRFVPRRGSFGLPFYSFLTSLFRFRQKTRAQTLERQTMNTSIELG